MFSNKLAIPVYMDITIDVANGVNGRSRQTFREWMSAVNELGLNYQAPEAEMNPGTATLYCIALYCIVSIHLYSASCSAHQSEALPVRETQREWSSLERTKRGTWLTSQ